MGRGWGRGGVGVWRFGVLDGDVSWSGSGVWKEGRGWGRRIRDWDCGGSTWWETG